MAKLKKKKVIIISIIIALIFLISFMSVKAMKSKNDNGLTVSTTEIIRQDIESNILTSGTVVSKEERKVTADLSGKIKEILVKEGDIVKKGDILALLDSRELEYELKQAQLDLDMAEDKLEQLKTEDKTDLEITFKNAEITYKDALQDYEDKKKLYESGAISKADLDEAKSLMDKEYNNYILAKSDYEQMDNLSEIQIQEKQVKACELEIEKYKDDLEKCEIKSPIDGTVIDIKVKELDVVGTSTEMFIIQDVNNLEIITNISEYDISKIKIGQLVKVTGEGVGNNEYQGVVKYISPSAVTVNNGSSTETLVEVKIDIKEKDTEFKPNFSANVEINTAKKEKALVIPYEALYSEKDGTKVIYKVENGKAKRVVVETGIEGDMVVEVIGEGLMEKDKVILNPTEMIKDGMDVNVSEGMKDKK